MKTYFGRIAFDEDIKAIKSHDPIQVPIGPVTRARAKKFKEVLNGLIQEAWAEANQSYSWRTIRLDPSEQHRIINMIHVLEESGQE